MEEIRQLIDKATIRDCALCGNSHEVELHRYNANGKGRMPVSATHFYFCPVTECPATLFIAADNETGLDGEVIEHLAEAEKSGSWIVIVCHMRGHDVQFWRKTEKFPKDQFQSVLDQTVADLRTEIGGPQIKQLPRIKLPEAQPLFSLATPPEEPEADEGDEE